MPTMEQTVEMVQSGVEQLKGLLANCVAELAAAQAQERDAHQAFQRLESERLQGLTVGATCDDALRAVASARIRVEALTSLRDQLCVDVAKAEAVLHDTEAVKATQEAKVRFNTLVEAHVSAGKRLDKSVRELCNALARLKELCIEQSSVGSQLGITAAWNQVFARSILGWVAAQLGDVTRELPEPRGQWQRQLLESKPWDPSVNPYCVPIPDEEGAE